MKWPGMDKIRDSADILQPEKEETYQFIEKLLSSVKESFSTNRVHLGMDEAVMLGLVKKYAGFGKIRIDPEVFPALKR